MKLIPDLNASLAVRQLKPNLAEIDGLVASCDGTQWHENISRINSSMLSKFLEIQSLTMDCHTLHFVWCSTLLRTIACILHCYWFIWEKDHYPLFSSNVLIV